MKIFSRFAHLGWRAKPAGHRPASTVCCAFPPAISAMAVAEWRNPVGHFRQQFLCLPAWMHPKYQLMLTRFCAHLPGQASIKWRRVQCMPDSNSQSRADAISIALL